jgi:hypothetical protein
MKKATAISHGTSRLLDSAIGGFAVRAPLEVFFAVNGFTF